MIGFIEGEVLFSDGVETIIHTSSGIGHQVYYNHVLAEGTKASLYISHVIREGSEELFGFSSIRSKKLFELLLTVKGVGPKSAFSLLNALGPNQVVEAVMFDQKKVLTKAPGIGNKGAAQIVLDLSNKIQRVKMYSENQCGSAPLVEINSEDKIGMPIFDGEKNRILDDALMACKELGFKEEKVLSLAKKILSSGEVKKAEQLVHLVLKEI